MAMDLAAAGNKVLDGTGGGTDPSDPFIQGVIVRAQPAATPLGFGTQPSLATAQSLPSIPVGALWAEIAIEGAAVRWRDDGTSPTAAVGMPLAQDALMTYRGNLAAIRFIQQSAGAVLSVSYYK